MKEYSPILGWNLLAYGNEDDASEEGAGALQHIIRDTDLVELSCQ